MKLPNWFNLKLIMYLNMLGFNASVEPRRGGPVLNIKKKKQKMDL